MLFGISPFNEIIYYSNQLLCQWSSDYFFMQTELSIIIINALSWSSDYNYIYLLKSV